MSGGGRMAAGWGGAWRPSLRACTPGREREKKKPAHPNLIPLSPPPKQAPKIKKTKADGGEGGKKADKKAGKHAGEA